MNGALFHTKIQCIFLTFIRLFHRNLVVTIMNTTKKCAKSVEPSSSDDLSYVNVALEFN